jgi:hypothetical protein
MLRTFEQRRDAYVDFSSALHIAYLAVIGRGEERADGWEREVRRKYDLLQLYASPEVFRASGRGRSSSMTTRTTPTSRR